MFDLGRSYAPNYQCVENESFKTIIARGEDPSNPEHIRGCGDIGMSVAFHIFYQIMVSQIFLNLFIAIIIDSFFGRSEIESLPAQDVSFLSYVNCWSEFDPEATKFINTNQLDPFIK